MRRFVTCYGLNVVLTLLAMKTFFNHGATYGFGREERWKCRRGWYLNRRGQKLLATHKVNGNNVALITPTFDFPKTWKKWVLYLSR